MKISYLGHSSFKITGKTATREKITIITDPFDPKVVGLPYPAQEADIVSFSHETHADHNYVEGIKSTGFFLLNTPGEYEIKGLRVFGVKTYHDAKEGKERGQNTIFIFDFEEARVAHLGDLGHELSADQLEELEGIDILLFPVGGEFTIGGELALKVMESIEPKIAIPMHYRTPKHLEAFEKLATVEEFVAEENGIVTHEKELDIKSKSDLPADMTKIIVLE